MKKIKKPILSTALCSSGIALMLVLIIVGNILLPRYNNVVSGFLGDPGGIVVEESSLPTGVETLYNKLDYASAEEMKAAELELNEAIVAEGAVLLKNEGSLLPLNEGDSVSFVGINSLLVTGATWGGTNGLNLQTAFSERGLEVNDVLWQYYKKNIKEYGLGSGSIRWGDDEDFSVKEMPLSVLQKDPFAFGSIQGTVPIFVIKRNVGEGRDMPRSMYLHTDDPEDQAKSYLEPTSGELEVLRYLNDNFDDVVLLVNATGAMELGWLSDFPNIKSVVYLPNQGNYGLYGLADLFVGSSTFSGHTVDTFAYDAFSSPAMANYGDLQYVDETGELTKYNYVSYLEGIYVGYKYYETRYEDYVLGQGNAGDYDYAKTVQFPFGYGLSYTTFEWSGFEASWQGDICTVSVTVKNTGDREGKDVVQIYIQKPYTDYARENLVEKSAVDLAGYAKTDLLMPGESQIVTVSFSKEQFKSYDYTGAKTYILDAGTHYITAAHDAHNAINNILAAKGADAARMVGVGDASFTATWNNPTLDTTTYAVQSQTGEVITNQLDFAHGGYTYLSRRDWLGTWPQTDGTVSDIVSTWSNEINHADGKGHLYTKTISAEDLLKLDSFDSLNPTDSQTIVEAPVYNAKNGVKFADLRGKDYDDPLWDSLLNNLTPEEYQTVITQSGYGNAELTSIDKPNALDQDTATGFTGGGTGIHYASGMCMTQSWNQDLADAFGVMIGNQAISGGSNGWYAPSMNMHRVPFSGRNGEYYSEDPFLAGSVGSRVSRGASSKGVVTYIKHFALNDQENHRGDRDGQWGLVTWSNEQAARELYLKPFEMCIANDPIALDYVESDGEDNYYNATRDYPAVSGLMTSFNRIGYTWTGGCYPLITGIVRGEWGFNGFIITDNANTGIFMDAGQMIEAGGDAKLTNEPSAARWTFDPQNSVHYHYGREAMHHFLYATVNSKLTNGLAPNTSFTTVLSGAQKIQLALNIAAPILMVLLLAVMVMNWLRWSKRKKSA